MSEIIYRNVEGIIHDLFSTKSWNLYGKNSYHGWWSPINGLSFFTGRLSDIPEKEWLTFEIKMQLDQCDFKYEIKEVDDDMDFYYGCKLIKVENENIYHYDVEFLLEFDWKSRIEPKFDAFLVLNNNKPIYRMYKI